jgi:hypothetical protein
MLGRSDTGENVLKAAAKYKEKKTGLCSSTLFKNFPT